MVGVPRSTSGQGSGFLRMSLAVCLLLPNRSVRLGLPKAYFSDFSVVILRVAFLAPSEVARASSLGVFCVVVGLHLEADGGRFASSRPALALGYFPDPPFFVLFPAYLFFQECP